MKKIFIFLFVFSLFSVNFAENSVKNEANEAKTAIYPRLDLQNYKTFAYDKNIYSGQFILRETAEKDVSIKNTFIPTGVYILLRAIAEESSPQSQKVFIENDVWETFDYRYRSR
ncbi:MAG: hypothetical protein FWF51_12270 [Chitinivibrionia bacterium]|nr:hypothetical protein [Chitinivibrionia bacterium]